MNRGATPVWLLLLLSLLLTAAKIAPAKKPDLSKPRPFFIELYRAAKANNPKLWAEHLSAKRRARGPDYIKRHLRAWRGELLKLVRTKFKSDPRKVKLTLRPWSTEDPTNPRRQLVIVGTKDFKITVKLEKGRLVIDEN